MGGRHLLGALALVSALACGDDGPDCGSQPLPRTDWDGAPWPSYTEASAELHDCASLEGYGERRFGGCADGKRFLDRSATFVGDTYYFRGDILVGVDSWSDVGSCQPHHYGDYRCDEVDVQPISCP